MPKLAKVGRIKPKYNQAPNAAEKRHHFRVMQLPCIGCGIEPCGVAHHLLQSSPSKRFRRDHRLVVPVCDPCHRSIHSAGSERAWRADLDCAGVAEFELLASINEGIL